MKRLWMFIGVAVLFLLSSLFSIALYGQPDKRPADREGWLNLTPEQKTKLGEFRKARQEENQAFFEQTRKLRTELRELMKDPQANEKRIDSLIDEMTRLRGSRMKSEIKRSVEMNKILTPEQLEKLKNARARMGRMGRLGPGRGMMPRPFMRHRLRRWNLGPGPDFGFPMPRRWLW